MKKFAPYILFLLITLLIAVININGFGPLDSLQQSIDDTLCSLTSSSDINPNIVIVTIDGKTQDEYGSWPWGHDRTADLLAAVASGEPKVIALDFMLEEDTHQDSLGNTDILAGQISWIENLVVPYDIALTSFRENFTNNPMHLYDYSVVIENPLGIMDEESSLLARKVFLPPKKILLQNPQLGFEYTMPDEDRVVRHQAMLMHYQGYYYPSLPLLTAATYLNIPTDQIKVIEGKQIELGSEHIIPINEKSEFFTKFPKGNGFRHISAASILKEGFNFSQLKNKLVMIEVQDFVSGMTYKTPVNDKTNRANIKAAVVQNIIDNNILQVKNNMTGINLIVLFLLGGLAAFIMPQVSRLYRFVILGGALILLGNVNYFLFSTFNVITQTVYFGLEILFFMAASPLLETDFIKGEIDFEPKKDKRSKRIKSDAARNIIEPELAQEPVPVRELKDHPDDSQNLNTMAISSDDISKEEDSGSIPFDDHQAINIDDESNSTIVNDINNDNEESDSQSDESFEVENIDTKEEFEDEVIIDDTNSEKSKLNDSDRAFDSGEIKTLGRYQVTGTLGKGAMGHVYKGIDPAINRPVALKTIRLDFVNDEDEMAELKERLFREAQAAGKLSHPNIVTIYDVGSENSLQYIAMEYLEGITLEDMIKKKTKFNYKIISKMIMQICGALEYAHDKGIVHRDIKPANIMVLPDYSVKLMDYGIARIDSASMTKTGIAMGTPNYISPEQLRGMPVDRRADIFSLGVVIYELLIGRRPFVGENISSLIYAITNNEPEMPSNINPQIPLLFDHIIDKALKKEPQERYQKAGELMHDLSDFVESFV